ncbi:MAG: hypothetical protein RLZZ200_185 [Pseudomonadota bacterium]|jgi:uncharacterized protein YbaP (TraB family)
MRIGLVMVLALCGPGWPGTAAPSEAPLDELVVTGEQPGPGLWEVRSGEHRLYLLGTITPLPSKMHWKSGEVEALVARSQFVLGPIDVKAGIGFFQGLRLLPSAMKARELPKGQTLSGLLQPALYARWAPLKSRYIGRTDRVERWRPMFAGGELYEEALKASQLERRDTVWPVVEKSAKQAGVPLRRPEVRLSIADPKGMLRDFAQTPRDADIDCFESLVSRVESSLPLMRQRANAWARGDVPLLRRLPLDDAENRCLGAVTATPAMAREYADAVRRVRQDWVLAAEGALLRNANSVAVVPLREILAADGLVAQLKARGYTVTEPD